MLLNNTTTNVCAICGKQGPTQVHHLSYDPEIVIHVCVPCHVKIHKHGVGKIGSEQKSIETVVQETKLILPIYTEKLQMDDKEFVVSINDKKILNWLVCSNCGSKGAEWQIFAHPTTQEVFIRCPSCGVDYKITIERRETNE